MSKFKYNHPSNSLKCTKYVSSPCYLPSSTHLHSPNDPRTWAMAWGCQLPCAWKMHLTRCKSRVLVFLRFSEFFIQTETNLHLKIFHAEISKYFYKEMYARISHGVPGIHFFIKFGNFVVSYFHEIAMDSYGTSHNYLIDLWKCFFLHFFVCMKIWKCVDIAWQSEHVNVKFVGRLGHVAPL